LLEVRCIGKQPPGAVRGSAEQSCGSVFGQGICRQPALQQAAVGPVRPRWRELARPRWHAQGYRTVSLVAGSPGSTAVAVMQPQSAAVWLALFRLVAVGVFPGRAGGSVIAAAGTRCPARPRRRVPVCAVVGLTGLRACAMLVPISARLTHDRPGRRGR